MSESSGVADARLPLPVVSVGATLVESDETTIALPAVVVDASGRDDVADLARVHHTEGIGDVRTLALRQGDNIDLSVTLTSPVFCSFTIRFDADDPTEFLASVCSAGSLVIATSQPDSGELCLAVDIDGPALAKVLSAAPQTDETSE